MSSTFTTGLALPGVCLPALGLRQQSCGALPSSGGARVTSVYVTGTVDTCSTARRCGSIRVTLNRNKDLYHQGEEVLRFSKHQHQNPTESNTSEGVCLCFGGCYCTSISLDGPFAFFRWS